MAGRMTRSLASRPLWNLGLCYPGLQARMLLRRLEGQFTSRLRDQACRKPDCNIAIHVALGFLGRVRQALFPE